MREEFKEFQGKTVLVTGATGFTGSVLTRKLVEVGANVRAIARQKSDLGELAGLDIQWYRGEVFDEDIVAQATPGVHYIFHLAAAFRETHPDEEGYRRVHLYSTQLLAKAAMEQPDFKCFLHVSTVGVHGHIEDGMADENYRFSPGDPYQRTKLEGELWITRFGEESGLPFSIIRPGPIFGPGDMRLLKLFRMVPVLLSRAQGLPRVGSVLRPAEVWGSGCGDRACGDMAASCHRSQQAIAGQKVQPACGFDAEGKATQAASLLSLRLEPSCSHERLQAAWSLLNQCGSPQHFSL